MLMKPIMGVKFPPSLFCDVDKGVISTLFRDDAVDAGVCAANALDAFRFYGYGLSSGERHRPRNRAVWRGGAGAVINKEELHQ